MKTLNKAAILIVVVLFTAGQFFAQDKPATPAKPMQNKMGMRMGNGMGMMQHQKMLNLTDEQKGKIQQLRLNMQEEVIKLNSEIQLNRVELKKLFAEKELNTDKMLNLTDSNSKLELQIKKLRTENWIKVYNLLDAKQKEVFKKGFMMRGMMNNAVKGRMQDRMGNNIMHRGAGNRTFMNRGSGMRPGMMQGQGMMMGQKMMQGRMMRPAMAQPAKDNQQNKDNTENK